MEWQEETTVVAIVFVIQMLTEKGVVFKMMSRKLVLGIIVLSVTLCSFVCHGGEAGDQGKLYVVGMGPAGPDLTAPRALRIVEKADVLLCSPRMPQRFEKFGLHIDPKKVALNPWEGIIGKEAQKLKKSDYDAWKVQSQKRVERVQDFIREKLRQGKTVAMMDGGDPCVYAPSLQYLLSGFDPALFEVIPGMGAFNAAAAALKTSMTPDNVRIVLLTSPESLFGESWEKGDEILKDLSKYDNTMVLYMSLSDMNKVVERFRKYYPPDFPIAIVYYAGYGEKEKVLKSNLKDIEEDVKNMDEKWLGLAILGKCAR